MKIGLNGAFWGLESTGSGQYLHELLQALAALAPEDAYHLSLPQYPRPSAALPQGPWRWQPAPTPFDQVSDNLAKLWFEQVAYPAACRRAGVELAHVPYFAPPLCSPVPVVVTIHDLIPLLLADYRGSWAVQGYMRLVARAARRAALVLTDSQASARDIEHILRIAPARIRVVYLAADARYRPLSPAAQQTVLARLQAPPRYLLYLGGFDRRKNVKGILQALAQVRQRIPEMALVIAGKLPENDSAFAPDPRPIARALGMEAAVHCTGWVAEEDKPALYAGATAFVFPSFYEGFGLPVLEALACGTPAVVGAGSALEEVAGPGGLAVPPHDSVALAEALLRLIEQPALHQELAQRGLRHAQRFSWAETARQTRAAYQEALSGTR